MWQLWDLGLLFNYLYNSKTCGNILNTKYEFNLYLQPSFETMLTNDSQTKLEICAHIHRILCKVPLFLSNCNKDLTNYTRYCPHFPDYLFFHCIQCTIHSFTLLYIQYVQKVHILWGWNITVGLIIPVGLPCFTLQSTGNPVELFRSMYRWHNQLVALGKQAEGQIIKNGCNAWSQNCSLSW